jgi:glycosyltransferase involved in cell wall biosynthesis
MRARIGELEPDLIAAHSSKAGWLARLVGRSLGVPVIFTAHGWVFTECGSDLRSEAYAFVEGLVAPLAARIVTVSEYDRRLAVQYGVAAPDKLVTVHNGIRDVAPQLRAQPGAAPPRLVMVARFSPQKDHATLIKVLSGLPELSWQIDFIGDGPLIPDMDRLVRDGGIQSRVRFLGLRKDVAECLAGAQLLLLTSNCEGLPLSILEAMRAGLPVIASDVGGVPELVRDGETGFLVARGDGPMLRDRLVRMIGDANLRERMGAAGRQRYEREFGFEQMFEATVAVYAQVLQQAHC